MKFRFVIEGAPLPKDKVLTVKFAGDIREKIFEIICDFYPFHIGMRKWDTWELVIKFDSETIVLPDGTKTYQTILTCNKAKPIHQVGNGK